MTPKEKLNKIYAIVKDKDGKVFDEIREVMGLSKEKEAIKFQKPTIAEVVSYCEERNNGIDGEEFYYFYESKGWKIGKSPMKSWKAAIITWEKNSKKNKSNNYSKSPKRINNEQKDELMEIIARKRMKMRGE